MTDHTPVPVARALEIAEEYDKDIVVITGFRLADGMFHTTTYGKGDMKDAAARLGEILLKAAGGDLNERGTYEDFRKGDWLIWSNEHRAYWMGNGNGYTQSRELAGRYSFQMARDIVKGANRFRGDMEVPNEAMILDEKV